MIKEKVNKNITQKFLSLVLGDDCKAHQTYSKFIDFYIKNNTLMYYTRFGSGENCDYGINLDTLGKECKRFCLEEDYTLMSYRKNCDIYLKDSFEVKKMCKENNELEAVLESTAWVIKEKGL